MKSHPQSCRPGVPDSGKSLSFGAALTIRFALVLDRGEALSRMKRYPVGSEERLVWLRAALAARAAYVEVRRLGL